MKINLIKNKNYFLIFSAALIILSIAAIAVFGLKQGIDMKGGALWQVALSLEDGAPPSEAAVKGLLKEKANLDAGVNLAETNTFVFRFKDITEEEHQNLLNLFRENFTAVAEKSYSSIGPTIGYELRRQAIWGIVLVLLGISLYVAYAFRKVSEPIRSWKYGIVTLVTLGHDVIIPTGLIAVLGRLKGVEIDINFIVALLVVMGFSVHDTIVVFDRIRENLLLSRNRSDLASIINYSVNETMVRSINTSLTLILVLLALMIFSPVHLFYFVLTILVGTIFGTYSSIFLASPLLYIWGRKKI